MSQKINKARIMQRLASRFMLTRLVDETFQITETILPITNVDSLLSDGKLKQSTTSITGNGDFKVYTVPAGKRWRVKFISTNRASGTFQFYRYRLKDVSEAVTMTVYVFTSTASETIKEFSTELWLEESDEIYVGCDTYSVTGNLTCNLSIIEEDAY